MRMDVKRIPLTAMHLHVGDIPKAEEVNYRNELTEGYKDDIIVYSMCMRRGNGNNSRHRSRMTHNWQTKEPKTAWIDNITSWTGLPLHQLLEEIKDSIRCRTIIHSVTNPQSKDS